jgi:outer membrane protein OmpA-like peptidoglycan-associated protein
MMKKGIFAAVWGLLMCQFILGNELLGQSIDSMLNLNIIVSVEPAMEINTKNLESSPVFYENGIVFVYAKEKAKLIDPKIGMPYFELMYSDLGPDGQPRRAVSFSPNINSRFHEGPSTFSGDFQQMYFTRSNFKNGKGIADEEKKIRLKIFSAQKGLEDWEEIEELPFCADQYSSCHPAISEDGSVMIFSSDMPGGEGGMDLFIIEKKQGNWQMPINLGPTVNTAKNEIFPTLHSNGVLFFSSNGHDGLGALDVFATHIEGTTAHGLIHMPSPFNSREDDLGLVIDETGQFGFIASARSGKKYKDDIFVLKMSEDIFELPQLEKETIADAEKTEGNTPEMNDSIILEKKPEPCLDIRSRIRKSVDQTPIAGATMTFKNDCGDQMHDVQSGKDGYTLVCLKPFCKYFVEVTLDGYLDHSYEFYSDPEIHSTWNIFLDPVIENVLDVEKIETGVTIVLDNIYYDFNKSAIQRGAADELEQLSRLMKEYPSMKIQLSAHTDARGTDAYNLELSERRAFAAKDFLVSRGISTKRITTVAKGESEIRNKCKDNVPCTESQHRFNRRTEVKVLEIDVPVQIKYKEGQIE